MLVSECCTGLTWASCCNDDVTDIASDFNTKVTFQRHQTNVMIYNDSLPIVQVRHVLCTFSSLSEENDETASSDSLLDTHSEPFPSSQSRSPINSQHHMADDDHHRVAGAQSCYNPFRQSVAQHLHSNYQQQQQSQFYSPMGECSSCPDTHTGAWPSISFSSGCGSSGANPNSLASCPPSEHYMSYQRRDYSSSQPHVPSPAVGSYSPSISHLEPPLSLHSMPPTRTANPFVQPYPCRPPACCPQYPVDEFSMQPSYPPGYYLPRTPGKVFVTYEADSDMHVREILNFVSLLRGNGFDTHIDQFEQQYRSISKIDFMEKYISEKDYLIIIVISPKYYETVKPCQYISIKNDESALHTVYIYKQLQNEYIQNGSKNFRFIPVLFPGAKRKDYLIIIVISPKYYETVKPCQYISIKNDESALHTVYIYKQLQNEYIQNGSKNFRFIPVLFPGAKRSHVPSWLQNTHVYHWPQDMQDILLRLMRVEKYNPPPVGKLPTILSKRI
ncbi:Adapter protein CIKS [Acipenser ruthenus]|uniref:Adapter protein CIKS n=1 Tax=Acipenser ruthenus TaxID=7906 RepID=A0A662YTV8_ACIRT|nr:Adapter protein CIKS [Acipenser ruthenus]